MVYIGWQQVDVKLTPAQEARVKDIFYRDMKATVGFEALWQAIADRDDPYTYSGSSPSGLLTWLESVAGGFLIMRSSHRINPAFTSSCS